MNRPVYVYMGYIRIFIRTCVYLYAFTHIFIRTYTYTYMHIRVYLSPICVYLYAYYQRISERYCTREIHVVKKPESFMISRAKISVVRVNSFVDVEQITTFNQFRCHCLLLHQNIRAPAWEGKPLPHLNLCT